MNKAIKSAEKLMSEGRYLEAKALLEETIRSNPPDVRLQQLLALALSKSGSQEMAIKILEPLHYQYPEDPETAGILAGIHKSIFKRDQDPQAGQKSYELYLKNYEITENTYTGINAASLAAIVGRAGAGKRIAREIIGKIDTPADIWEEATVAEALMLIKEREKAVDAYRDVRRKMGSDWGKVTSVANQIWLLKHYIHVPREIVKIFAPPNVYAFVGHMIDTPDREKPRYTNSMVEKVDPAIASNIESLQINIGYCSLACGADIQFAEAMIHAGREVHIILPFRREDFIEVSVRVGGEQWVKRFEAIEKTADVVYLSDAPYNGDDYFFQVLGKVLFGQAIRRAEQVGSEPGLLTVLSDYDLKMATGGTRNLLDQWPFKENHHSININPYLDGSNENGRQSAYKVPQFSRSVDRLVSCVLQLPAAVRKNEECMEFIRQEVRDENLIDGEAYEGILIFDDSPLVLLNLHEEIADILDDDLPAGVAFAIYHRDKPLKDQRFFRIIEKMNDLRGNDGGIFFMELVAQVITSENPGIKLQLLGQVAVDDGKESVYLRKKNHY